MEKIAVSKIFGNVRALRALNMRRRGVSLSEIAAEFAITKERARQLVSLGEEVERRALSNDPWDELSTRVRNAIWNDGCDERTPDGVVEHFKTRDWKRVPYFGKKSLAELNAWLVRHGREPIS
jgi:hypothetical protein